MTDTATTQAPTETVDNLVRSRREALGVGRSGFAELTGLTPAKVWRIEGGRPQGDELDVVNAMLANLETNGLPEHMQPRRKSTDPKPLTKAERLTRAEQMVAEVNALLIEARDMKTAKELRAALNRVGEIVNPQPEQAADDTADAS